MAELDATVSLPGYDVWRGEFRLLDPQPNATDALIRQYVESHPPSDAVLESAMTEADGYALLAFARRSAVFAMRARDPELAQLGRTACSLVKTERVDPRDILVAQAIIDHAVERTRSGVTAGVGQGPSALRDRWGRAEVEIDGELGLIGWGFRDWSPSLELVGAIVDIGRLVDGDRYVSDDPLIATELPSYWLRGSDDERLGAALATARATASVGGRMRPDEPDAQSQQLTAWLVELDSGASASALAAISDRGNGPFASVAASAGPLLALVIARSFVAGVPSIETSTSMARFGSPIEAILQRALD